MVFSGLSNPAFAAAFAKSMKMPLGRAEIALFANGEKRIWIQENVKEQDVYVVQSFSAPVDSHIIEFLLIVDALERAGARSITAILPWMGYSLQDKIFRPGEPIAARVIANLISNSAVKRVFLIDLHNESIVGFFGVPTFMLSAFPLFAKDTKKYKNSVIVAPDAGALKRSRKVAETLNLPFVSIEKSRDLATGEVTAHAVDGTVTGKTCLIFDDIISTGSTLVESAKLLKQQGATKVIFYATHGLFAGEAITKLEQSEVDEVVVTDTIAVDTSGSSKIRRISVASLFAEAVGK